MSSQRQKPAIVVNRRASRARTLRRIRLGLLMVLLIVVAIVLMYNRDPETLDLLGWKHTLPLCVWLVLAFGAGAIVGGVGMGLFRRKQR